MRPYGATVAGRYPRWAAKFLGEWKLSRGGEKRAVRAEIEDQVENALHPAELQMIDCAAGNCPSCNGAA